MTLDEKFMIKDILLDYCAKHKCKNCNFDNRDTETNKCKLFHILYELSNCEVE